jgi:hypothetical protein
MLRAEVKNAYKTFTFVEYNLCIISNWSPKSPDFGILIL